MNPFPLLVLAGLLASATSVFAETNDPIKGLKLLDDPARISPDPDKPRPIPAIDTVFLEDMTWLEVRDAIRGGATTALVLTGGLEMNGPYMVTGKHNINCRLLGEAIARELGDTLVATVVPYVPEGEFSPPSGHLRYPGTIGVREATFQALLTDIAESLRLNGFNDIILMGDSGGNQDGMKTVADSLSDLWRGDAVRIHYIAAFYNYPGWIQWCLDQGIEEISEGIHDLYRDTIMLMLVDPEYIRMDTRRKWGLFSINGVPLDPAEKTLAIAERLKDYQVSLTADAIREALANR